MFQGGRPYRVFVSATGEPKIDDHYSEESCSVPFHVAVL